MPAAGGTLYEGITVPAATPALLNTAAAVDTSILVQSLVSTPLRKTCTSTSSFGSPAPSVSVLYEAPSLTSLSCPFFDCLPLSVIGSLKTSRFSPLTVASQH